MGRFAKNLWLWSFVVLCLVCIPLQPTTYDASACGGCGENDNPDADPDAKGFYDTISGFTNWAGNFYKKYKNCKEIYYKRSGSSGSEDSWIDISHIHYHVSHGGEHSDSHYGTKLTAVIFEGTSTEDDKYLDAGEARSSWGDKTLDWIGFRCCTLLNDNSWKSWAKTMNGLHLILGFKTVSKVADNFGKTWANKMLKRTFNYGGTTVTFSQTIPQAWFSTVDKTQPSTIVARVIGETDTCYSDHLHGNGSVCDDPDPDDTKKHWDHRANPRFRFVAVNVLPQQVRIPQVISRVVDEARVRQIGEAFGFGEDHEVVESEDSFMMARADDQSPDPGNPDNPSHLLTVFKNSGIYYYQNLGRLWKIDHENPTIPGIYPEANAPQKAYDFLTDNSHIDLYPDDVDIYAVDQDEIVEENLETSERTVHPVYRCVAYSRAVEASEGVPVSVVGPGARLKVYIDEDGSIMGAMGNWREVQTAGTTPIMTKEAAWNLFVQMGQEAVMAPIFLEYDSVQTDLNTAAFGYYEHAATEIQTELIPVWIFETDYYKDGELIETAYVCIPAAI